VGGQPITPCVAMELNLALNCEYLFNNVFF
jgi:hypothetical protein